MNHLRHAAALVLGSVGMILFMIGCAFVALGYALRPLEEEDAEEPFFTNWPVSPLEKHVDN